MSVDKNEAPEGYEACELNTIDKCGCYGCAFYTRPITCKRFDCIADERKDECEVIFKKKETDK
jgi:hypothetical protein